MNFWFWCNVGEASGANPFIVGQCENFNGKHRWNLFIKMESTLELRVDSSHEKELIWETREKCVFLKMESTLKT